MKKIAFNYGDDRWSLYKVTVQEIVFKKGNFKINEFRQRKYLYNDIPTGQGHKWQRELFDTLLAGQPIPLIELNKIDEQNKSIEDGQQRIKTIIAICGGCVTVSENVVKYGEEYRPYIGCHFAGLPDDLQEKIRNSHLLIQSSEGLNEDELYQRFVKINDGNPLTAQDKRSGMNNDGAKYIQSLVDTPKYKMFEMHVVNDKISHKYNKVPIKGRELEEVIAHCFNYVRNREEFKVAQPNLQNLYTYHFEKEDFDLESKAKKFEKYLKVLDISMRAFNQPDMIGKKLVSMAFFVIKKLMDDGYKVNTDTFFKFLTSENEKLKSADKLITFYNRVGTRKYPKGKEESFNYVQLFRLASTKEAIQEIVNRLSEGVIKRGNYSNVDSVRAFTKKQRHARWVEQKECCEYCGESVEFEHSVGDHREPHSEGGETVYENLAVACKRCNGMKSNMSYDMWTKVVPSLKFVSYQEEEAA